MKRSVQRAHDALKAVGIGSAIVELHATARTATDAAAAIGTTVPWIVKSLVFMADQEPLIVLASGANRVDTGRLGRQLGKVIERATPDQVRAWTGYAVGGVAPLGYPSRLDVVIDRDLLQYDAVWAAAGSPNAVFAVDPADLARITAARVCDVKEQEEGGPMVQSLDVPKCR